MSKKYEDAIEPVLRPRNLPPDDPREIELHNLTHLPYAPWCGHCVAMKAKESPFRLQEQKGNADSSKPTVSFDFCFTATATSEEPPATCLVVVDDWTKAVLAVPVSAKGGPIMMKHVKEAVVGNCNQRLGGPQGVSAPDNSSWLQACRCIQKVGACILYKQCRHVCFTDRQSLSISWW